MAFLAIFKKALAHLICLSIIIGATMVYFGPQLQDNIIAGTDVVSATAWGKHVNDYQEEKGEPSFWNPAMFSGMPWRLLKAGYQYNLVRGAERIFRLWTSPPISLVYKAGIISYFALILLGISPFISLLGAIAFSFNLNYIILLEAGHESKFGVIGMFPFLITGLILCFRERWKTGMALIAFTTSLAIINNHIQMVYYLMLCFVVMGLVYLIYAIKENRVKPFIVMSSLAILAALIGAGSNFALLRSASAFADDTMRGKPILENTDNIQSQESSSTKKGLDWNYAMQWSNDGLDLASIVVPRIVGGSSYEEVSAKSEMGRLLQQNNARRGTDNTYQAQLYWGNLPFTSGPYYSSIIIVILFTIGFFILPGRLKWALGAASIFILLLSMGKNASWLNKPMFDFLPLLNKFRAPSSAITILPVFLLFGSTLTLHRIFTTEKRRTLLRPTLLAGGSILGLLLLLALAGSSMLSFEGIGDARYAEGVREIFKSTRVDLFTSDVWRSIGIGGLFLVVLFSYLKGFLKNSVVVMGILLPILFIDLYTVNKRHLDADNWESKKDYYGNFDVQPIDQQIMQAEPKGRGYYRVFDVPNMKSSIRSYHHNTIGGYSAAKLQRYQDMLDYHINKGSRGALNMLNAKYIITPQNTLEINPQALGNAWAVTEVNFVNGANEEIEALSVIDPGVTAIVNQIDFPGSKNTIRPGDGNCEISLSDYAPDQWVYQYNSTDTEFIVFSEVWYNQDKGMTASIDGQPVDFVRANYILRGLQVPAGRHEIIFKFKPIIKGASISIISSILIFLLIAYACYSEYMKLKLTPQHIAKNIPPQAQAIRKKKKKKKTNRGK